MTKETIYPYVFYLNKKIHKIKALDQVTVCLPFFAWRLETSDRFDISTWMTDLHITIRSDLAGKLPEIINGCPVYIKSES